MSNKEPKKMQDGPDGELTKKPATTPSKRSLTRRDFVKVAATAGVAITATAGIAKTAVSLIPEPDYQAKYDNDVLPGDRDIANSKLTLMTDKEKRKFVKDVKKNYKYTT